jgi:hypothetical protein
VAQYLVAGCDEGGLDRLAQFVEEADLPTESISPRLALAPAK